MPRGTALPEPAGRTAGATGDGCESGHPAAVAHGGATATAAGAKRPPVPPPPATSSSSHTHSTAMERLTAAAADALGPVPAPSPAVAVQVPLRYRGMRLYRLPYSPPSVEAVQLWLARHPLPAAAGGATAAAAAAARQRHTGDMHQQQQQQRQTAAASFRLDSTTGRFIPVTPGAASRALPSLSRRLSAVGPQSLTTSHPALGASQEGGPPPGAPGPDLDLACTPALLLSDPSQYREGGLQQQQLGSGGLGGSQQQDGAGQEQELEADMLEVQPASPKYDERSFFFSGVGTALVRPTPLATASRTLSARSPLLPPSGALAAAAAAGGGVAGGVGASPASAAAAAMLGPSAQPLPQQLEELEGFAVQPQQYRPGRGSSSQEGGASTSRQAAGDDTPKQSGGASEGQPTAEGPPAAEPGAGGGHIQARQQLLATGLKPLKTAAGVSQISPPRIPGAAGEPSLLTAGTAVPPAAPSPPSELGFKQADADPSAGASLSVLGVEVLADSRGTLLSDPRYDAVRAIALVLSGNGYTAQAPRVLLLVIEASAPTGPAAAAAGPGAAAAPPPPGPEAPHYPLAGAAASRIGVSGHGPGVPPPAAAAAPVLAAAAGTRAGVGAPAAGPPGAIPAAPPTSLPLPPDLASLCHLAVCEGCEVTVSLLRSEAELLAAFAATIQALDPDALAGWDVQQGSLGYLVDRAKLAEVNLLREVSRTPQVPGARESGNDEWGTLHASGLSVTGRMMLNLWRLMRSELKLSSYSLASVTAAVLRQRVPHISQQQMSSWFAGGAAGGRWRALSHLLRRTRLLLQLMDTLDLLGRAGELAATFGIDIFSVLTRGSQYRVESLLMRLAHSQNYLGISPSRDQVGSQPATEALPLVMEPESRMYTSPLVVLDFQSLYPSLIIAYNLCYTTCIGRPQHADAPSDAPVRMGVTSYALPPGVLVPGGPADPEGLIIAPNGVAYLPQAVRPGVLPRMLHEILATRVMVKDAMKRTPASDRVRQRVLNARQFGLKMISNVTYGYTSAGFSGRMPFAELADSIVQAGRVTLENAIRQVEGHPEWRARVVYGDTDSLFVLLPGRSRAEAFRIGKEIAEQVTAANPRPIKLKMEKVYHPCLLQTKKRYVGFSYEHPGQVEPIFDAKGIETVRRDSCPAVSKMLEGTLRLLFSTADLSAVKAYVTGQLAKIMAHRVSVQDFVFCKEVRLGTYSPNAAVLPPAAIVAAKAMAVDPRAEPRFAERIPYVVVAGSPGARLVDLVVSPTALVEDTSGRLRLGDSYYIHKQILPALERVLSLVGADVRAWWAAAAKPTRLLPQKRPPAALALAGAAAGGGRAAGVSGRGGSGGGSGGAGAGAAAAAAGTSTAAAGGGSNSRGAGAMAGGLVPQPGSNAGGGSGGFGQFGGAAVASGTGAAAAAAAAIPGATAAGSSSTIDSYYLSRHCAVCDALTRVDQPLCVTCAQHPQMAMAVLAARTARLERQHQQLVRLCLHCGGGGGFVGGLHGGVVCDSLDCGVYYERKKAFKELRAMSALASVAGGVPLQGEHQ